MNFSVDKKWKASESYLSVWNLDAGQAEHRSGAFK